MGSGTARALAITFADGDIHKGEWVNDRRHGSFTYTSSGSTIEYECEYVHGKKVKKVA